MSLFQQRIEGYLCHCLLAGYNISLCWHVLSKKPSSQLGYWATALPCTLHFLPFSRLFWINVTLQCTDSFQSSLELFNCLWGFPSRLFFLCCKIENKSFCQIWRTLLLLLLNFLSFFVTKRVRRVKKKEAYCESHLCSLLFYFHLVQNSTDIFQHTKIHFACLRQCECQRRLGSAVGSSHIASYKQIGIHWSE